MIRKQMKARPLWLLCAAFLLAQLAALLHTTQHELTPDDNNACEICAIAQVATPPPALALLPPPPEFTDLHLPVASLPAAPTLFHRGPLTTGPPVTLV